MYKTDLRVKDARRLMDVRMRRNVLGAVPCDGWVTGNVYVKNVPLCSSNMRGLLRCDAPRGGR